MAVRRDLDKQLTFAQVSAKKIGLGCGRGGAVMKRTGNRRMAQLGPSEIRAMTQACVNAKGVNMAQGVCDIPVPLPVLEGAKRAMDQGFTPDALINVLGAIRRPG